MEKVVLYSPHQLLFYSKLWVKCGVLQFKRWYTNLSLVKSMRLALVSYCTGFIYCTESKRVAIFCVKGVFKSLNLCMECS